MYMLARFYHCTVYIVPVLDSKGVPLQVGEIYDMLPEGLVCLVFCQAAPIITLPTGNRVFHCS